MEISAGSLIVSGFGLLGTFATVGAAWGVWRQKVEDVERRMSKLEENVNDAEKRLNRGDTRFEVFETLLTGISEKLDTLHNDMKSLARDPPTRKN